MTRVRVVTPELLDSAVANLVNTAGTASNGAVQTVGAGGGTVQTTGVVAATPNTLVQRDASGRTQFASPAVAADVATKGYVDTTVSGYVATSTLGTASGVATLDGNSFLTTAQVPQYLHQHRGSGTSFPTGIRTGDTYLHTGIGCLFSYNGTSWKQAEEFAVANHAALTAISTNYSSLIHVGLRVWQSDWGIEWMWNGSSWAPTNGETIQGKLFGAGSSFNNLVYNQYAVMYIPTFRGSGGTSMPSAGNIVVPVDGYYRISGRGYLTGGVTGQAVFNIQRSRPGVGDVSATQSDIVYKPSTTIDQNTSWSDVVPLKAGDTVWMMAFLYTNTAMQWFMSSETSGSNLTVVYNSPLLGATAL